jgi:hypothetical protein
VPFDIAAPGVLAVEERGFGDLSATVTLLGGGSWSSSLPLAVGGLVELRAPQNETRTYTVDAESRFGPFDSFFPGTVAIFENTTLSLETMLTNDIGIALRGGTISGPGPLLNNVGVVARQGRLGVPGRRLEIINHDTVQFLERNTSLHGTLLNRARTQGLSVKGVFLYDGARLTLEGDTLIDNQGDLALVLTSTVDGAGRIRNSGILAKGHPHLPREFEGGRGVIAVPVDNREAVVVFNGVLDLAGGVDQVQGETLVGGEWVVHPEAALVIRNARITTIGPQAKVGFGANEPGSAFENVRRVEGNLTVFRTFKRDAVTAAPGSKVATSKEPEQNPRRVPRRGGAGASSGAVAGSRLAPVPVTPAVNFDLDGGLFLNEGSVVPGDAGAMAPFGIEGDYTQTASGSLHLDVGAGEHDQLSVSGAATLGGNLEVVLMDGYVPLPEDEIVAVAAASINGTFANARDRLYLEEGAFEVTYTATSVVLSGFDPGAVPTGGRATRTPTAPSGEPTPTATGPTPVVIPSGTPTPTPTPGFSSCPGDCNGDGSVTVAELVRGVALTQGNGLLDECPSFDLRADGAVAVDELLSAVKAALEGCARFAAVDSDATVRERPGSSRMVFLR